MQTNSSTESDARQQRDYFPAWAWFWLWSLLGVWSLDAAANFSSSLATDSSALSRALRRAANDAAALAWVTAYPLLVFPALLEEKVRAALRQYGRQAGIRRRSANLLLQAA